jgi:FMN phosphatase YigB (HAD superfamily)
MKKILTILAFFSLINFHVALAEVTKTSILSPIELAIQHADSETLVIFDVDDVLITAKDQILQPAHKKFLERLNKDLESRLSEEEAQILWSIIWLARSDEPVDPKMVSLIKEAQSRGLKVMALTNAWTGPFGNIPSLEDWRIDELQGFGYTFKDLWSTLKLKTFKNLKSKDPKRFPVFQEGVLFTCNLQKGEALKTFLQYTGFSPKKIIFIDDKQKHLKSVEAFSKDAGIPFVGFQYTAIAERPRVPLNEERARLQFLILEKEHKWLNDEEADKERQRGKEKHER